MLIPLGTDRRLARPTVITHWLIGANVVAFVGQLLIQSTGEEQAMRIMEALWLDPQGVTLWGFFSYQFLHGGFLHILGNMIFLYVFGPNIEDRLGRWWFLAFYLAGGVAAGLMHVVFEQAPVVGASGSIAAVTGAYIVLFPRTRIKTLVFFFIIGVFEIPATWFIGFAIVKDIFLQGVGTVGGESSGTAHLAHIGGYIYGAGVSLGLLWTGLLKHEDFDLFNMGRQARRRRQFKSMTKGSESPWAGRAESSGVAQRSKVSAREEAIMGKRREIASLISSGDVASAAEAYTGLLREHGPVAMNNRAQLELANYFFEQGQHEQAARAYSLFLDRNSRDSETPRIKLMLGLLYTRYLGRPADARPLLREARRDISDAGQRELAEALLGEIGEEATST